MVDEAADIAHAVAVDDNAAVQMNTVVVTFIAVLLSHTTTELRLTYHLTNVLSYKLTYTHHRHRP